MANLQLVSCINSFLPRVPSRRGSLRSVSSACLQRCYSTSSNKCAPLAYALTSYFCLPEQGMKEFELLSRASLTVVESKHPARKKFHLLGPAHVTHPWHFKNFYPVQEWLSFLREDAVRNEFSIKERSTGKTLLSIPLAKKSFRHTSKDLVVLHFEDESAALRSLSQLSIPLQTVTLEENVDAVKEHDQVDLVGHELRNEGEEERLIPMATTGEVNVWHRKRGFIRTPSPVPMGICGGPILHKKTKNCVGIVEALVPAFDPTSAAARHDASVAEFLKRVSLNAVCLPSEDIIHFLESVESL